MIFVAEMLQQLLAHRIAAAQWSWSRWLLEALLGSSGVGLDQQGVNLSVNLGRDIITHAEFSAGKDFGSATFLRVFSKIFRNLPLASVRMQPSPLEFSGNSLNRMLVLKSLIYPCQSRGDKAASRRWNQDFWGKASKA